MQFHRRARGHHARDVRVQVTACIFSRLNGRPNTTATQDEALSATARLRAFLKALKYCRRPDLPERLDIILAEGGRSAGAARPTPDPDLSGQGSGRRVP